MKFVIMSYTGNVGKSTVTSLLSHSMNQSGLEHTIISIESINADVSNKSTTKLHAKSIFEISTQVLINDNLLIDVGASNVEEFLKQLDTLDESQFISDIDLFIVVVPKGQKEYIDASSLIDELKKFKINKEKIVTILNRVENPDAIDDDFCGLIAKCHTEKSFTFSKKLYIEESAALAKLAELGHNIDIVLDPNINKEGIKAFTDPQERDDYGFMLSLKLSCTKFLKKFDTIFEEILKLTKKSK